MWNSHVLLHHACLDAAGTLTKEWTSEPVNQSWVNVVLLRGVCSHQSNPNQDNTWRAYCLKSSNWEKAASAQLKPSLLLISLQERADTLYTPRGKSSHYYYPTTSPVIYHSDLPLRYMMQYRHQCHGVTKHCSLDLKSALWDGTHNDTTNVFHEPETRNVIWDDQKNEHHYSEKGTHSNKTLDAYY